MKGYKLTNQDYTTYDGMMWGENVTNRAQKGKMEFCSKTAIHYYKDPLLAAFLNPIHANFNNPILWEGEAKQSKTDGLKCICKEFTTVKQVPLPQNSTNQRIAIAIRSVLKVYREENFVAWAEKWLSGEDRSEVATEAVLTVVVAARPVLAVLAAAKAAVKSAKADARSATWPVRVIAWVAARAAIKAATKAADGTVKDTAWVAARTADAWAADAVDDAAWAAVTIANEAAAKSVEFNLLSIIKETVEVKE